MSNSVSGEMSAANVTYLANKAVSDFIVLQAQERLRALQAAAHALDSRTTQVAAFQFAASAFAVAAASAAPMSLFACTSAISFVIGGVVAFRGIRSDPIQLPGIPPSWWQGEALEGNLTFDTAKAWAAGLFEEAIKQIDLENCERARHLNLSLNYAVAGAVLIACASFLKIFA